MSPHNPRHRLSRVLMPMVLAITLGAMAQATAWAADEAQPGSPGDPNILYVGRWDTLADGVRKGYWSGVYLRAAFTGLNVAIRVTEPTSLSVSIDGHSPREITAGPGVTILNDKPLDKRDHTIQVGSAGQNYEVAFAGLQLDPGAVTKPVVPRPLIEYIGDSITQGNESYAWRSAQMLGCDHVQIAFSGVALTDGFGCSTKVGMAVQYFRLKNFGHKTETQIPWTFSYTPQIIVINLGQNDACGQEPDEIMTASYRSFAGKLRAQFPQAKIVAVRPFSGAYAAAEKAAVQSLIAAGDTNLVLVDTTGWIGPDDLLDHMHPSYDGSVKAGRLLANVLYPLLKTTK